MLDWSTTQRSEEVEKVKAASRHPKTCAGHKNAVEILKMDRSTGERNKK